MSKKISEQLAEEMLAAEIEVSDKKINKAQYDKSYSAVILGINQDFTDDVTAKEQETLINKYSIKEVPDKNNYYTFKINGNYYVKSSNTHFKLYEKVIIRVPNGSWDNMYIEANKGVGNSGVSTQLIASVEKPTIQDYTLKDGDYWIKIDNEDDRNAEAAYQWDEKEKTWRENASFVIRNYTAGKGIEISDENEISTKIDNLTMAYNDNGEMVAYGISVTEEAAPYLLNQYTKVGYINNNPVGYGGAQNPIIVQGYVIYPINGVSPNGVRLPAASSMFKEYKDEIFPDIEYYGLSMSFNGAKGAIRNSSAESFADYVDVASAYVKIEGISSSIGSHWRLLFNSLDGEISGGTGSRGSNSPIQITFLYDEIFSPGTKLLMTDNTVYESETGCVRGSVFVLTKTYVGDTNLVTIYNLQGQYNQIIIPFATCEEYISAMSLIHKIP